MNVSEAASRVGKQVYHAGQGQDERARTRPAHLLRGLDSAWSVASNPHRESGTRWRAAADVGATRISAGAAHGREIRHDGNRLGDSVGAPSPRLPWDKAALRGIKRTRRAGVAWTQAACCRGA